MRPLRFRGPALALSLVLASAAAPASALASLDEPVLDVVTINGGAYGTNDLDVTVEAPWPGAVTMRISNDSVLWSPPIAWAASVPWSLDDAATGGDGNIGNHGVWVQWFNGTDQLLETGYAATYYDISPPSTSGVRFRIESGRTVSTTGAVPFGVYWLDDDHGGIGTEDWDVERSTDGGAWTHIASPHPLPGFRFSFVAGHSYRLRVRGIDLAGNVGAWATGATFTVKRYQESSTLIKWSGTWSRLASSSYWGGASRTSTRSGSTAKITFTGRRAALVTRVGPSRGAMSIYVNGVFLTTVTINATTTAYRRVVWEKTWTTSATRTITVKLLSVPNRTRGDVDAFVTGS